MISMELADNKRSLISGFQDRSVLRNLTYKYHPGQNGNLFAFWILGLLVKGTGKWIRISMYWRS